MHNDHLTTLYSNNSTSSKNEWVTSDAFSLSILSPQDTNSDAAYLAGSSSYDESDSRLEGADSPDFDLPWRKRKTILEEIRDNKELTPPVSAASG